MAVNWTADRIRTEIRRLDDMTGLSGAELAIRFTNGYSTVGCFHGDVHRDHTKMWFSFSNIYFKSTDFPEEMALNVIRHEYAHYLEWMTFGKGGHGPTWKVCCNQVGAPPVRLYQEQMEKYFQRKRREQDWESQELDQYRAGTGVLHPTFGLGTIREVKGQGPHRFFRIQFDPPTGERTLIGSWVLKHCLFE